MLFLDFSAAFDTVDHSVLLHKLKNQFRIEGTVLKWLKYFLTNRKVYVNIEDHLSKCVSVDYGVP